MSENERLTQLNARKRKDKRTNPVLFWSIFSLIIAALIAGTSWAGIALVNATLKTSNQREATINSPQPDQVGKVEEKPPATDAGNQAATANKAGLTAEDASLYDDYEQSAKTVIETAQRIERDGIEILGKLEALMSTGRVRQETVTRTQEAVLTARAEARHTRSVSECMSYQKRRETPFFEAKAQCEAATR